MTIKFIAIAVILLLQINPSLSFANDKADSLSKAKARRDSILFEKVGRDSVKLIQLIERIERNRYPPNIKYYTNEFREQMRYYEIRNKLLKKLITEKMLWMFNYLDSNKYKEDNFKNYFNSIVNMGDTLELYEYKIDTNLKVKNSLVYKYWIANDWEIFHSYDWKNTGIEDGKIQKFTFSVMSDYISPNGYIAIDTTEENLNKIIFISENGYGFVDNYFDYCGCPEDSNSFVDYLYYKYHIFNKRYDNIHKVGKVTYKINSSFPHRVFSDDCDEIYFKYVKFVLKDNKWVDVDVNYMEDIE